MTGSNLKKDDPLAKNPMKTIEIIRNDKMPIESGYKGRSKAFKLVLKTTD